MAATDNIGYPVRLSIDAPTAPRDRLSVGLRIFYAIPIGIVLGLVSGGTAASDGRSAAVGAGGLLAAAPAVMIIFRQKYPRWWFDWNVALSRFSTRVGAYFLLLRDEYPSTDDEQAVHLDFDYPDVERDLNRWMPLVKWFLAIPHFIVLFFLFIAAFACTVISWFSILFTGSHPEGLRNFVIGVMRWENRVLGYAVLMVTDRYPPFSLD